VEVLGSSLTVTVTCDLLLLLGTGLTADPDAVCCALLPVFERVGFAFSSNFTLDMTEAVNELDILDVRCSILSCRWRFAEGWVRKLSSVVVKRKVTWHPVLIYRGIGLLLKREVHVCVNL